MSLHPRTFPDSLSVIKTYAFGRRSRPPGSGGGSTGRQIPYYQESGPIVHMVLVHDLKRAIEKKCCHRETSNVFWPREMISCKSQPRCGRIMTFGSDTDVMRQDWDSSKATKMESQSLFSLFKYTLAQDLEAGEHRVDHPGKKLDREIDGRRYQVQGGDVDKHYQVISHCRDQQEINIRGETIKMATDTGKDASYTSQDDTIQDRYKANLGQFIDGPTTADPPRYKEVMGSPRFNRLGRVLGSFISPAVVLSYPTLVSAAALSWKLDHHSTGILPPPFYSLRVYRNLTKAIESAPPHAITNSNVALMLPWSPGVQILQYLAICSVASVLVYLQGTGAFLKYPFMVCSGLLGLICVSAGTEMMLRLLPLTVLLTLLASWVFQVFAKIIWGLPPREVQVESVATPGCALKTPVDKHPNFSATSEMLID